MSTLTQIKSMVGEREKRCTYPHFLHGKNGELVYIYRDGGSGNGSRLWNVYDEKTQAWRRLIESSVFSGKGERNAYYVGPVRDAKGTYHIVWVWRETPDCETESRPLLRQDGRLDPLDEKRWDAAFACR